jgi:DNA-binding CsgD family transcriptional regulator
MQDDNKTISDIYDCAANPDLWPETLNRIRDFIDCAYVMRGFGDFSGMMVGGRAVHNIRSSDWDQSWFAKLEDHFTTMPYIDVLFRQGVDSPWVQHDHATEAEFHQTPFYKEWVKPQKLRDCINVMFMDRKLVRGVITFATHEGRPLISERQRQIANFISPHIRRAVAINDMVDKGNLALSLFRKVLDSLAVAVCIVSTGGRLVFANARAEAVLSSGALLKKVNGKVATSRNDLSSTALEDAIERGLKGDTAVGISGIGVPITSLDGERAAAYVLPIRGDDIRSQMGDGHAVVFIAQRGEQQPMAVEILRTLFDLTPMESKVAYATSLGESPEAIATAHGIAIDTVRSHLKKIYLKTDVTDKTALAARVNALMPPINAS